ncbi:hypothetical protein [Streptococcus ruminantium]|uniref:hypothetical protein n=1 Tax=Streptococcus ruminantium TaxID=1917441 RepID=UPI0012DD548E|nr:hypothetical protein [Streptococcus ruminantium]
MDTAVDAAQGGNISPASIGTSLAINAIIEGVSSKTVKGQKGDIAPDFKAIDVDNLSVRQYSEQFPKSTGTQIAEEFVTKMKNISKNKEWGAKNFQSTGGYNQAKIDFESLGLSNVKQISTPKHGEGMVGSLPDGTKVVIRQRSISGGPTLEFQTAGTYYKIRYGE